MSRLYLWLHSVTRRWIVLALLLVAATFGFSFWGWHDGSCGISRYTAATVAYQTLRLFTLDSDLGNDNCCWQLEVARWLGAIGWASAVATVLIALFQQRALTAFVACCSFFRRGHVIVAGLGPPEQNRERLIERLRAARRDVVVLEHANHPGLEACRAAGAVCLTGSPQEVTDLRRAQLARAGALVALGDDDRQNIQLLGAVADLLGKSDLADKKGCADQRPATDEDDPLAPSDGRNVGCVIQFSEPGMLEVLRRHELHRDPTDRLHLRIFNRHELIARAMLRESLLGQNVPLLRKVLLLGTGSRGRLGEALVLRAAKDAWLERADAAQTFEPLEIHVFDRDAKLWIECLRSRHEIINRACRLVERDGPPAKCGFRTVDNWKGIEDENYDAAFVCVPDESHALMQAAHLRNALDTRVPVVVRMHEERAGFGELLRRPNAGGLGENLRVVGTHDRVFDVAASMQPFLEIIAQALHQDYLALTQRNLRQAEERGDAAAAATIARKAAFRPWSDLDESYRESNRALAMRLREHLTVPQPNGRPARRFRLEFCPGGLIEHWSLYRLSDQEPNNELERMAEREHELWCAAQRAAGWRYAPAGEHTSDPRQKLTPNLVEYSALSDGMKEYDRDILRRLPYVFAKADYKVVEVKEGGA